MHIDLNFISQFYELLKTNSKHAEDDPPLIFLWKAENLERFIIAIPLLVAPAGLLAPFALPIPLTIQSFTGALL